MKNAIKVLCFTLAVIIVGTSAFLIYFKWDKSQFEYVDGTEKGAIFHCYSEDAPYAKKCLDAGMNVYFSFAGNLTYRNARNLHETVLNIPLDRILLETESPFMIPAEFREKKRTMPAYLPSTARFLAEMLETDLEKLSAQLWTNSCKVFNLPEE